MIAAQTANPIRSCDVQLHAPASGRTVASVWWLHPAILFIAVVAGTLLPAVAMSERTYTLYSTPKYVDADAVWLGVLACLMVACGTAFASQTPATSPRVTPTTRRLLVPWFYLAAGLTLLGYAVWMANGIRHGFSTGHVIEMVMGAEEDTYSALKFEIFRTIPGITTCSQFALLAVVFGPLLRRPGGSIPQDSAGLNPSFVRDANAAGQRAPGARRGRGADRTGVAADARA